MNSNDRANLEFLMNLSVEGLATWYDQASNDDIEYANELLTQFDAELSQLEFDEMHQEYGVSFLQPSSAVH
jgi:hypothetical protein